MPITRCCTTPIAHPAHGASRVDVLRLPRLWAAAEALQIRVRAVLFESGVASPTFEVPAEQVPRMLDGSVHDAWVSESPGCAGLVRTLVLARGGKVVATMTACRPPQQPEPAPWRALLHLAVAPTYSEERVTCA
jgi:hypothetical protein